LNNDDSLFHRLKDTMPYLKSAQMRIATFVKEKPRVAMKLTVTELAHATKTAASTVVEFCKRLGYAGFSDLKISLAQEIELVESMTLDFERVSRIAGNLVKFIYSSASESLSSLSASELEIAAGGLLPADKVEIFAFGFDAVAGLDLFVKLKQLGFQCNFYENPFMQSISAYHMTSQSVGIAISSSHSSRDILDSIQYAKRAGSMVISIAAAGSKIAAASDVVLPTYSKTKILPEGGILTRYIQLLMVDSLFLKLLEMDRERFASAYRQFEEIINYKRRGDRGVI